MHIHTQHLVLLHALPVTRMPRVPPCPQFETSNKVVAVYSQVHTKIYSGASMTMTPHASLINQAQQCNMRIKMADASVLNSNIKRGFLDATCNGKLLQKLRHYMCPI